MSRTRFRVNLHPHKFHKQDIHEQALKLAYQDNSFHFLRSMKRIFQGLYLKNVLATDVFKVINDLLTEIMKEVFKRQNPYNIRST